MLDTYPPASSGVRPERSATQPPTQATVPQGMQVTQMLKACSSASKNPARAAAANQARPRRSYSVMRSMVLVAYVLMSGAVSIV